jgi:hypothetical protein
MTTKYDLTSRPAPPPGPAQPVASRRRALLTIAGGVGALAVGYAYWVLVLRRNPNSDDVPDGTHWICKTNGHHFDLTLSQLSDHHRAHYGEPVPCPKCNSTDTIRANRCPKCGEYYPQVRGAQPPCPKCGTPQQQPS